MLPLPMHSEACYLSQIYALGILPLSAHRRATTLCQPRKRKEVLRQYTGRAKTLDRGRQVLIIFNYTFLLMFLITEWLTLCLQCLWDRFLECLLALQDWMVPHSGKQDASSSVVKQLMRFWFRIDLYAGKRRMEFSIKSLDIKNKTLSSGTELQISSEIPLKSFFVFMFSTN